MNIESVLSLNACTIITILSAPIINDKIYRNIVANGNPDKHKASLATEDMCITFFIFFKQQKIKHNTNKTIANLRKATKMESKKKTKK